MTIKTQPPAFVVGTCVKNMQVLKVIGHYKAKNRRPFGEWHYLMLCDAGHEAVMSQNSLRAKSITIRDNMCPVCHKYPPIVDAPADAFTLNDVIKMRW